MIVLKSVKVKQGEAELTFEFSDEDRTRRVTVNESDIIERLRVLKQITGRGLTLQDVREVSVQIINEIRKGGKPLRERFDYDTWIGLDLEAQKETQK